MMGLKYIEKLSTAVEEEGRDKTRWINCGALFLDEKTGLHAMKIDVWPAHGFTGWIRGFEPDEKRGDDRDPVEPARRAAAKGNKPADFGDDVPF